MGVSMVNTTADDDTQIDLTLFGIEPNGFLAPETSSGSEVGAVDGIVVSETLADDGVEVGTVVTLDRIDVELEVVGFTDGQATFGHVDMAYLPIDTWRPIAANAAEPGAPTQDQVDALEFPHSSVVAVQADEDTDLAAIDSDAETESMTLTESFNASPGYEAETLTLSMIQIFLYAICALVVGAFFTVWTIQRTPIPERCASTGPTSPVCGRAPRRGSGSRTSASCSSRGTCSRHSPRPTSCGWPVGSPATATSTPTRSSGRWG